MSGPNHGNEFALGVRWGAGTRRLACDTHGGVGHLSPTVATFILRAPITLTLDTFILQATLVSPNVTSQTNLFMMPGRQLHTRILYTYFRSH